MAQTAVEWLINELKDTGYDFSLVPNTIQAAEEMEEQQHGATWDAAIKAHDDRGHVHARSLVDFDEYYNETYIKK
jgi:hypothetical protein